MKKLNTVKQFVGSVNSIDKEHQEEIAKPVNTNSSHGKELIAQLRGKATVNISTAPIMTLTRGDE